MFQARALIDQGSEISLVSEHLDQMAHIHRQRSSILLAGIGAQRASMTRGVATFTIKPYFQSFTALTLHAHILPQITTLVPFERDVSYTWPHLKGLSLADPHYTEPGKIDILIGANLYGHLLEGPIIQGPINSPTAQLTKLGWIISGPYKRNSDEEVILSCHNLVDRDLSSLLDRFWRQEEVSPLRDKYLPPQDQYCEHFVKTHARDFAGRYIVRLPFKISPHKLGDSAKAASQMLTVLKRKFDADPNYLKLYSSSFKEYESLDHMVQVHNDDAETTPVFYVPHHGIRSSTSKFRVVFNGSCQMIEGVSLNEALHSGPKLQNDLSDVLVWIRQFRYIFVCDIEKMYRQIKIHPDDQRFQRIMWLENGKTVKYQLTTVTYGLSCAPFLALRCINQLMQDEGHRFPLAIDILCKGRYVDDIFGGGDSVEIAKEKLRQTKDICLAGGFPLRKWISNCSAVITSIPDEHRTSLGADPIHDHSIHTLGISWKSLLDCFSCDIDVSEFTSLTKRSVLSQIARFFDPLGFLSPLFIRAKVFTQELWGKKFNGTIS